MEYKGKYPFPPILKDVAKDLASLRTALSKDVYKEGTEKHRGKDEEAISYLGILAEMVARNFLIVGEVEHTAALLVDLKPVVEPDIVLFDGKTIDVKGVKPYSKRFYVNKKAHDNIDKKCDFYWFVLLMNFEVAAEHYIISHKKVSEWKVEKLKYTDAYVYDIPKEKEIKL
tara:strand:+ start:3903 stop:4415 length:513 start_codon:yes stop_codon:yes gene_type:complete